MPTFTVAMQNQTIVADATLVFLRAEDTVAEQGFVLEVLRATVSQVETETQQQLGIILGRKVTAFGTYTSTTPTPHAIGGAASGITGATDGSAGTAGTDASAEGAGAVTAFHDEGFDNRVGFLWVPTPEERPILANGEAMVVKLRGTPSTLTGWSATLTYRELV